MAIEKLQREHQELLAKLESFEAEKAQQLKANLIKQAVDWSGNTVVCFQGEATGESIKNIAFQLRAEHPAGFVFIAASIDQNKPMLTVSFSEDLVDKGLNAGKLVREAAKQIQGGGGGQAHYATAGGKNPEGLSAAIEVLTQSIQAAL